ncbi:MAG: hypothetical protein FI718_02195 [SAR202 cluster bacterium]|nr:hypothetical protein [SAR202 cluster bacterium]|tara:strand:+ start:438 stop:878 length:441 start_codon:yes stop_codon:yes gene_type:complete
MDFEKFLNLEGGDFRGRTLKEIWRYTDIQIEQIHDFIQVVFPLNKPSNSNPHTYYLNDDTTIERIQTNETIKQNIIKSSKWFLSFLKRNESWKKQYNHNHLRITRIIECLRLLVSDEEANKFHKSTLKLLGDKKINKITVEFWGNA